jgi:DMSO reductase anchor subunit
VWLSSILLVGLMTLIAMAGPVLVRRRVSLDQLRLNNEVAGFKFATVGVLYAVLLGFAVITVWEKLSEAENAVAQEAAAVATLYRLAQGVEGDASAALRDSLTRYVKVAIAEDWPAMEQGQESRAVTQALNKASST